MPHYDEQILTRVFDSVFDPFAIYDLTFAFSGQIKR